jgi:hypothetical protein
MAAWMQPRLVQMAEEERLALGGEQVALLDAEERGYVRS